MKRKLLFAIAMLLAIVGVQPMFAQTWEGKGNIVAPGEYYLYNVESGKYLAFGANWGTRATLVQDAGAIVTVASSGDGYTLTLNEITTSQKGLYLSGDAPYCDRAADAFTFTQTEDEGTVYTISKDGKYLCCRENSSAEPSPLRTVTDSNTDGTKWILVTKQDRIDALKSATIKTPADATFYIKGADIEWKFNNAAAWDGTVPAFGGREGDYEATGYAAENYWGENVRSYQTLTGLLAGKYVISCYGFYRDGSNEEAYNKHLNDTEEIKAWLYANKNQTPLLSIIDGAHNSNDSGENVEVASGVWIPNSMSNAVLYFFRGRYAPVEVEVTISQGESLEFGIYKEPGTSEKWTIWDRFRMKYIDPYLSAIALPFNGSGELQEGQWYVYDVASDGDYEFSVIDGLEIVKEDVLLSEATSSTLPNTSTTLNAGKLFFKSSKTQNLEITAQIKTYEVGEATTSSLPLQPNATVTVSYKDLKTNDKDATPIVIPNGITFNDKVVTATPTSDGFTFSVPEDIEIDTEYTLSIPANIIGYEEGKTYNEKQDIPLTSASIFNGTYFFKVAAAHNGTEKIDAVPAGKYLSRGRSYGTQATLDAYGLPIQVSMNEKGNYTLSPADTKAYYFHDKDYDCYADGAANKPIEFKIELYDQTYTISNLNNSGLYLKYNYDSQDEELIPIFDNGDGENDGPYILWETETPKQHATAMKALKDAQATTISEAASDDYADLKDINTIEKLANMAATYKSEYIIAPTNVATVQEKFECGQPANNNALPETVYSGDIEITKPGLYKFSIQAFYRMANNSTTQALHDIGADIPAVAVFFGDAETQIVSVYDGGGLAEDIYNGAKPVNYNGNWYADNMETAKIAFQNNLYNNDVWVYIDTPETYTYGVKYMGCAQKHAQWFIYSPESVSITYYGLVTANLTSIPDKWGTFAAPFAVETPEGVEAYTITNIEGSAITLGEPLETISAGTPVILKNTSGKKVEQDFKGRLTVNKATSRYLTGVFEATSISGAVDEDDNAKFVLQVLDDKQAFYQIEETKEAFPIPANRCYLTAPIPTSSTDNIKAYYFTFGDDDATAIKSITESTEDAEQVFYNLAGQRVTNPTKGIYIVNGQKVLVK